LDNSGHFDLDTFSTSDSFPNLILIAARDDPARPPANVAARPRRQDLHLCINATARLPYRHAARRRPACVSPPPRTALAAANLLLLSKSRLKVVLPPYRPRPSRVRPNNHTAALQTTPPAWCTTPYLYECIHDDCSPFNHYIWKGSNYADLSKFLACKDFNEVISHLIFI
jgi:hypothetical protein